MDSQWQRRSWDIHQRFVDLSRGKGSLTSDDEVINFLALAICGEAGELANLIKKRWQGDPVDRDHLRDEIADIRIYLEHLAHHLEIDVDEACNAKLDVVVARLAAKERAAAGGNGR
jgi:NTP pyrophosphatase (non-canonical NTP hydrolase)